MRARVLPAAPVVAVLLLLAGCDAGSALTDDADLDIASKGGPNPIVASVTGSGHAWITPNDPAIEPFWRTFTLSARKFADGTAKGRFQYNSHEYGTAASGDIECLEVSGNVAVVKALPDRLDDPYHPDIEPIWFIIEDGQPDRFTPGLRQQHVLTDDCILGVSYDGFPSEDTDSGEFTIRTF